jgi:hypothetical protein
MADDSNTPKQAVDDTPISPTRPGGTERKNSLENHLIHRPPREELVESQYPSCYSPKEVNAVPPE